MIAVFKWISTFNLLECLHERSESGINKIGFIVMHAQPNPPIMGELMAAIDEKRGIVIGNLGVHIMHCLIVILALGLIPFANFNVNVQARKILDKIAIGSVFYIDVHEASDGARGTRCYYKKQSNTEALLQYCEWLGDNTVPQAPKIELK